MNTLSIVRRPASYAAAAAVLATLAIAPVAVAQSRPEGHSTAPVIMYIPPSDRHYGGHVMLGE